MAANFEAIIENLYKKSDYPVGRHSCRLWTGALKYKSVYGKCRDPFPGRGGKYTTPHKAAYLCHIRQANLNDNQRRLEISHICHNPLCIMAEHMTLEDHMTNQERQTCKFNRNCSTRHLPHCLL